jgi:hypothetical protein
MGLYGIGPCDNFQASLSFIAALNYRAAGDFCIVLSISQIGLPGPECDIISYF